VGRVSGAVTHVEFTHDGATLVSAVLGCRDGTHYWDVQSGKAKFYCKFSKSQFSTSGFSKFFKSSGEKSSGEQKVGKFIITAKGDILRIFKSEGGVTDKADKDTVPVAFFRAPGSIKSFDTSGSYIVVGCHYGVLHLRAAVLLTGV
jgi:hypothetical protein